jgi:hypothetical protein
MKLNLKLIFTEWIYFSKILFIVSFLLFGARLTFTDSLVIYVQKDKPASMQVFFPVEDFYNEENSAHSFFVRGSKNSLTFSFPRAPIDHIRIDPANEVADIVITKIERKHLLGTEIYMPNYLLAHSKAIQMIDSIELNSDGLLIHTTGHDPAFELKLNKSSWLLQFIMLGVASVFLSLAIFFSIEKIAHFKIPKISSVIYLLTIPLLISLGVAALFYPGFMSYDTLHAIRGARNGITDSMWPPMVSYIWRAVDLVSLNPSAMHFSQIFLLIGSIFLIVFFLTKKVRYSTAFLFIYLSIPAVLGTVAVIWKDVLMAAFFLAGFAIAMSMRLVKNKWTFIFLSLIAMLLIFLGVCTRHNAITGAVPLVFYLAWIMCSRMYENRKIFWIGLISLGSVLTIGFFATKIQLDNYTLPGFVKIKTSTSEFVETVRVLDIAGASLCVGKNLFAETAPNLSIDEIRVNYDPRHINLSKGILERVAVDSRINKIWIDVAVHHPICFFNNKFELTKYLVGANKGEQFLITAPSIDENEYGYSLSKSSFRDAVVTYIVHASKLPFFKPWFLYLMSIFYFIYMVWNRKITGDYLALFLSAYFYFAGLVLFGNAADARLVLYTSTVLLIFTFSSLLEFKFKRSRK